MNTLDEMVKTIRSFRAKYPEPKTPVVTVGSLELFAEAMRRSGAGAFPAERGERSLSSLYGVPVFLDETLPENEMRTTDEDGNTVVSIL